jgi:hypothetical protein
VPTDPGTDQLWPQGLGHIKGHAKLYILSGGQRLLRGSWPFGAGVWEFPHTNFEIFVFGGYICTHGSSYRPAMDKGVWTYQRSRQTVSCIRWWSISVVILAYLPYKFRNFWGLGNHMCPWIHPQARYTNGGWCI